MSLLKLPLSGVIGILGLNTAVTVVYRTTTMDADGFPTTAEVSAAYQVALHPISGRDLNREIGGNRTEAGLQVFSTAALPEGAHLSYAEPGGAVKRWLIIRSQNWTAQAGHWRSWCIAA